MTSRTVVLHYHLFKNAGTSVDQILKAYFGPAWVTAEFPTQDNDNTVAVEDWIAGRPEAQVFSSHTMVGPFPQVDGVEIIPVILLRDPVARIVSAYRFEVKQDADTWGAQLAKAHDLEGYVQARLARQNDRQCRNFQVSRLASICPGAASEYTRALNALKLLNAHGVVGRVEQFDAFTAALKARLDPHFADFVPTPIQANKSQSENSNKDLLSDAVLTLLAKANAEDTALLEQADKLRESCVTSS